MAILHHLLGSLILALRTVKDAPAWKICVYVTSLVSGKLYCGFPTFQLSWGLIERYARDSFYCTLL